MSKNSIKVQSNKLFYNVLINSNMYLFTLAI